VKTITVREVRLHWPRAEQALRREGELVVTRDGKPVARLLPFEPMARSGARFAPAAHLKWLKGIWKDEAPVPSTDAWLREDRDE
jgi:antitoxin (DNA-binding transcriptional repressor) of toxin-antitoxin stability system